MPEKIILTKVLVVPGKSGSKMESQTLLSLLSKDRPRHTSSKLFYKDKTLYVQQTTLMGLQGWGGGEQCWVLVRENNDQYLRPHSMSRRTGRLYARGLVPLDCRIRAAKQSHGYCHLCFIVEETISKISVICPCSQN